MDDFPQNCCDVLKTALDDLALIRVKQDQPIYVRMTDTPDLLFLNLFDYEYKNSHFQSCPFGALPNPSCRSEIPNYLEQFVNCTFVTVYKPFADHIKECARDTKDLPSLIAKLTRVMNILKLHERWSLVWCSLRTVFREVMQFYRDSQPRDLVLLIRIFDALCFLPELKQYAVEYFLFDCDARYLRRFLDTAVQRRFSFWTMWERRACVNIVPFCPVTSAYFSGRLNHLRVLLDYGFQQTHQRLSTLENILRNDNFDYNRQEYMWLKSVFIKEEEPTSRSSIIGEVLLFIYIWCNSQLLDQEQKVKSFHLLWQARKEPLITKAELIYAIGQSLSDPRNVRTMHIQLAQFMSYIDFYKHILPFEWEWRVLQPRSLSHLCRCSIRKALNDNWEMPFGIEKLAIPDKLKNFILLRYEL